MTAPVLAERLRTVIADRRGDVVVDLERAFLDSTALKVLVEGQRRLHADDRRLMVVNPSAFAERVLTISGVAKVFDAGTPSTGVLTD